MRLHSQIDFAPATATEGGMSGLQMAWVSEWHRQTRKKWLTGPPWPFDGGPNWTQEDVAQMRQKLRPVIVFNRIPPLDIQETAEEREERIMAAIRNIGR